MTMRYGAYEPQVNAILDAARAADLAHEACPEVPSADIIGQLAEAARPWTCSLIEIIMVYEKRERQAAGGGPLLPNASYVGAAMPDTLKMVPQVTRQHGKRFAEECAKLTNEHVTPCDVFSETGIFEWPDDVDLQERYQKLKREIFTETMSAAGHALAEAFVTVANDVIERERRR